MEKKRLYTETIIDTENLAKELRALAYDDNFIEEQIGNTTVYIIEKYFFRNNSTASCTVCMHQEETGTDLLIICSGAGQGIMNFSLGAAGAFMEKVENVIHKYL